MAIQRGTDPSNSDYGNVWSSVYDEFAILLNKAAELPFVVEFIRSYAPGGIACELGVGNGHIAIPLSARGVKVFGIDNSTRMIASLKEKTDRVDAAVADMRDFTLPVEPDLVYCINQSFSFMLSQEDQLTCLAAVSRALRSGGLFIVHLNYPQTNDFSGSGIYGNQKTTVMHVDDGNIVVRFTRHERNEQITTSQDIWLAEGKMKTLPTRLRYVYPAELDLLCRIAGFSLVERFGGWRREPFDGSSWRYVSVYRKI
ncbi:class I SAM-dependent methyltransferase [Mesorhizobium plurifarium]|nr:class I SAM-dependent methyltransferase [Sinorhizobium arboris]PST20774.1 class I SAM-dependent methyltransferase [Mesorhizobium plurifarium]